MKKKKLKIYENEGLVNRSTNPRVESVRDGLVPDLWGARSSE